MPLRNGEHGYGWMTRSLHWATFLLMAGQFAIGYGMDADAAPDRADARIDALEDACESEDDAAEERCEEAVDRREDAAADEEYAVLEGGLDGGLGLVDLHVLVGLTILGLAVARTVWRSTTPLPPWDERLTPLDRRIEHTVEVTLLTTMYVIPLSGLWMVLADDDAVLPLHVAGHVAFFVALAVHVGLVLLRGTLGRMLGSRSRSRSVTSR